MKRIFFTAIFIAAALVAFAQLEQPKPKPAQPKPAQPSTEKPMQSTQKSQKQIQCEQRWKDGKEAYDNGDYSTALFFFNKAVDDGCDNMPYSDYIEMCNIKMSATPKGVTQQTSTPQSSSQQSSIQQFFPIYGVTLGQTTTNDAKQMGYKVEKGSSGTSNVSRIETIYFWDHNNDNVYEQIYMTCYDKMPQEWINKFGFNVDLSYSEWLDLFKKMGFTVEIKTTPQTTK
ncbi:MAG: hypothetical protein LBN95_11445 [Prevotellaceae bacterium]|jgi:hypothetical protein|nr:hypothetical protein [Prevotellaceae bacterium]